MNLLKEDWKAICRNTLSFLRWIVIATITGLIVGIVGTLFVKALGLANGFRGTHPEIILALPLAGLAIVFLYKICRYEDRGTNHVIATLHGDSETPFRMAPLIFISTILTHMFGGSAGREGAALQLGGSIGNQLGRCLRLNDSDRKVVFSMEVSSVGFMQYAALVPCMIASLVASTLASALGAHAEAFTITDPIDFAVIPALKIVLLGICCALISILFYRLLHEAGHLFQKYIPNAYLRILVSSVLIIGLTILLQTSAYSGAGVNLIEEAFDGHSPKLAFLWKMIFTALTLGAGFKGGEIVPSFTIGATFGCLFGTLLGISPSLCAAVGMVAVFCGVTNCPIASLLIGFEMFGFGSMRYLFIGVAISYMLSGYGGLYATQKIAGSKFRIQSVDIKAQ